MKQFNYIVTLETAFTGVLLFLRMIGLVDYSVKECFYPMLFGIIVLSIVLVFVLFLIPIILYKRHKEKSINEEIDRFLRNMEKLNDLEEKIEKKRKEEENEKD